MIENVIGMNISWNYIFCVFLIVVAVIDAKTSKIPNKIVIPVLIFGLLGAKDIVDLLFKIGSVFLILIIGYTRIMGMGDLKLWMCMAVYIGLLDSIYAIGIAAAVFVLYYLIAEHKETVKTLKLFKNQILYEKKIVKFEQKSYPFGPFMAIGSFVIMIWRYYA